MSLPLTPVSLPRPLSDPTEFEDTTHYLRSTDGEDIEPHHTLPEDDHDDDHDEDMWALVILSTLIVNLATLSGVAFLGMGVVAADVSALTKGALSGFASVRWAIRRYQPPSPRKTPAAPSPSHRAHLKPPSQGALMSCAVFLILVESSHMIASEYPKEKDATWRWGAAVLGGFLTPLVFFLFEPSGNALEFKTMKHAHSLFARYDVDTFVAKE